MSLFRSSRFQKLLSFALLMILFSTISATAEQEKKLSVQPPILGESYRYRITWDGEFAGYSKFFVDNQLNLAGEVFYQIESVSQLKIGMGEIDNIGLSSQMTVRAKDLLPTYFACIQKQSGMENGVDCLFSNNLIAQKNVSAMGERDQAISLEREHMPNIFMNNLWGRIDTMIEHYWVLFKAGRTGKIYVYDPVLQYQGDVTIEEAEKTAITLNGKTLDCRKYVMSDFQNKPLFHIWVDGKRRILRMEEPGGGLTFELTDDDVHEEFKQAKGVDVWKNRISRSNIFFPNIKEISRMEAQVEMRGRGIETNDIRTPGFSQSFEGQVENGDISGVFTVSTSEVEIKNPPEFPLQSGFSDDYLSYTRPEIGIESDDDYVHNLALEITWKSENIWVASQKINEWVSKNIPRGVALPSAKMTMTNEQGNSESKALLAIALCRSVGIPARRAGGVIFSGGSFIPHYWYEVYLGESGWISMDPTNDEVGRLNATHIRLFSEGEVWDLKTRVLDFDPSPPDRVTYFNREIVWPVGEERVYAIISNGQKFGEEHAKIEDVTVMGDKETYRMKLGSKLIFGERLVEVEADYWMSPEGLPVKFTKNLASGETRESQTFELKGRLLVQEVTDSIGTYDREIPISTGVYLVDTHILSLWALLAGQFPNPTLGMTYEFSIFIPETTTVETITAVIKKFEAVEAGEEIYDAFRVETSKGIIFWLEKQTGRVVKISFKNQDVDLELISSELKI